MENLKWYQISRKKENSYKKKKVKNKTGKNRAELSIHILISFIIGIYPLLLFEVNIGSFRIQHLILTLCTLGVLLYCFLQIRSGEWSFHFYRNRLGFAITALTFYVFIKIIHKIIITSEKNLVSYEYEMTILALSAIFFLLLSKPEFKVFYLDILCYSALVVFALLLMKYFCGDGAETVATVLLKDKEGIASYTILVCIIGIWQYLKCKDRLRSFFYISVLVIGFLVLFVNQSRISIWIMIMVFLVIPLIERPTAELVKKDMQMFFIFLFMLCNMSLLTNYTKMFLVDIHYDIEQSVYLELLVVIGGFFFFRYWNRIPEGVDLRRLIMRKMRRGYQFLARMTSIIFVGIILGGNCWSNLPDSFGMAAVKGFAIPLVNEVYQGKSAFYLCFEQFGVIGSLLVLAVCVLLIIEIRKNLRLDKPITSILVLIASVFLVQLLFFRVSISILPVYWIFTILAVSYKEKKEKVSVSKFKFE